MKALKGLGANDRLYGIVSSFGRGLSDEDSLSFMKRYNNGSIEKLESDTPLRLFDKDRKQLSEDCIIWGEIKGSGCEGKHFWRIYTDMQRNRIDATSCTCGYAHGLVQSDVQYCELIGSYDEYEHVLVCD